MTPLNRTALPAVSIVSSTASTRFSCWPNSALRKRHDDEQRVVDAEREREHQREVHGPDRDRRELGEQEQRAGRGQQAEHRQQQRKAGGDERAEREHEDAERHRPGEQLRAHHRGAVGLVEVRPHARRAGQRDLHLLGAERGDRALEVVGGADHRVRVGLGAGHDDRGVPVARDRRPGLGQGRRRRRARRSSASPRRAGSSAGTRASSWSGRSCGPRPSGRCCSGRRTRA